MNYKNTRIRNIIFSMHFYYYSSFNILAFYSGDFILYFVFIIVIN